MKKYITILCCVFSFTTLASTELACFGTEPFFSAAVTRDSLYFNLFGEREVEEKILSKINARGTREFAFTVKSRSLSVSVITGDCNDGMSDRIYSYHLLLEKGDQVFYGCCNKR